jgi:hypothetical protein
MAATLAPLQVNLGEEEEEEEEGDGGVSGYPAATATSSSPPLRPLVQTSALPAGHATALLHASEPYHLHRDAKSKGPRPSVSSSDGAGSEGRSARSNDGSMAETRFTATAVATAALFDDSLSPKGNQEGASTLRCDKIGSDEVPPLTWHHDLFRT